MSRNGARDIESLIQSIMEEHKLRIDRDATSYLVANLGSEKLSDYRIHGQAGLVSTTTSSGRNCSSSSSS